MDSLDSGVQNPFCTPYSKVEVTEKVELYLQAGAEEVWIFLVDYYGKLGKLDESSFGIHLKT